MILSFSKLNFPEAFILKCALIINSVNSETVRLSKCLLENDAEDSHFLLALQSFSGHSLSMLSFTKHFLHMCSLKTSWPFILPS